MIGWMKFGVRASDGFDGQAVWTKPNGRFGNLSERPTSMKGGNGDTGRLYKALSVITGHLAVRK